jgi:hypothetical protein
MRQLRLSSFAFACLAASAPLRAQAPTADPLYYIEVIVFAYLEPDRGDEDFRHGREGGAPAPTPRLFEIPRLELETLGDFGIASPRPSDNAESPAGNAPGSPAIPGALPATRDGLALIELAGTAAPAAGPTPPAAARLPDGFRILGPDELDLVEEAAQLRRLAPYRVLGHVGWAQTGVDDNRAVPVDLKHLGITNPGGTITFWIGAIRHAAVDLEYVDGSGSFWSAPADPGLAPLIYGESYHLEQASNDVLRELWYVDHPLFGVLLLVRVAPEPGEGRGGGAAGVPAA